MRQSQSLRVFSSPSRASGTAIVIFLLCLCSCVPKNKTSSRLKVIASMPVVYDWTRNLMDESTNTKFFLNLIIKNGLNYHNQTPGTTEENLINTANLLIYVGGPSEQWIDEIVENTAQTNPNRLVLKLIDYIEQDNAANTTLIDEHFILSPLHAITCCQKITEYLCLLDQENADSYNKFYEKYCRLISILDDTFRLQAQKAEGTTFIICDRMPLKYVFEQYGFNYIALYDTCPALQTQIELETIKQYGKKIDESGAQAVYVFEDSDKKLANKIIGNSKNPKCDTLVFDSMESLTLSQLFNGKNYINIMQNNLTLLRPN